MEKDKKDSPLKFYAKYSALAFQMIVIIVGGAFGGKALDNWVNWSFPVFTEHCRGSRIAKKKC